MTSFSLACELSEGNYKFHERLLLVSSMYKSAFIVAACSSLQKKCELSSYFLLLPFELSLEHFCFCIFI